MKGVLNPGSHFNAAVTFLAMPYVLLALQLRQALIHLQNNVTGRCIKWMAAGEREGELQQLGEGSGLPDKTSFCLEYGVRVMCVRVCVGGDDGTGG